MNSQRLAADILATANPSPTPRRPLMSCFTQALMKRSDNKAMRSEEQTRVYLCGTTSWPEIQRGLHNNAIPRRSRGEWLPYTSLVGWKSLQISMCVCVCVDAWQHLSTCVCQRIVGHLSFPALPLWQCINLTALPPTMTAVINCFLKLSLPPQNSAPLISVPPTRLCGILESAGSPQ